MFRPIGLTLRADRFGTPLRGLLTTLEVSRYRAHAARGRFPHAFEQSFRETPDSALRLRHRPLDICWSSRESSRSSADWDDRYHRTGRTLHGGTRPHRPVEPSMYGMRIWHRYVHG